MSSHRIAVALVLSGCAWSACAPEPQRDAGEAYSTGAEPGGDTGGGTAGTTTTQDPVGGGNAGSGGSATGGAATAGASGAANGGSSGASSGAASSGAAADDAGSAPGPSEGGPAPTLPSATGSCPAFSAGTLSFSAGGMARTARVWIDSAAAAAKDGPVVFYWHGTGSSPMEAQYGLGASGIASITALGGMVVAPEYSGGQTFPWIGDSADHYKLVDEVLACAEQEVGIDARQIHSIGMSAGGLFTSALSFARANLLASVAVYSGGGQGSFADPNNKFAALIFYGGSSDNVFGQNFENSSKQYATALRSAGHFALLCNHDGGHNIPGEGPAAVVPFFLAHPYGTASPYEGALPSSIPSYCEP